MDRDVRSSSSAQRTARSSRDAPTMRCVLTSAPMVRRSGLRSSVAPVAAETTTTARDGSDPDGASSRGSRTTITAIAISRTQPSACSPSIPRACAGAWTAEPASGRFSSRSASPTVPSAIPMLRAMRSTASAVTITRPRTRTTATVPAIMTPVAISPVTSSRRQPGAAPRDRSRHATAVAITTPPTIADRPARNRNPVTACTATPAISASAGRAAPGASRRGSTSPPRRTSASSRTVSTITARAVDGATGADVVASRTARSSSGTTRRSTRTVRPSDEPTTTVSMGPGALDHIQPLERSDPVASGCAPSPSPSSQPAGSARASIAPARPSVRRSVRSTSGRSPEVSITMRAPGAS